MERGTLYFFPPTEVSHTNCIPNHQSYGDIEQRCHIHKIVSTIWDYSDNKSDVQIQGPISVMGKIAAPKLQGDVGIGFFDIQAEQEDDFFRMIRRSKRRILLAIEVKDGKAVKAISRIVDDIKPDYARQIIKECVSPAAHLTIADGGVRGFKKMVKEYQSATVYYGWGHLDGYFAAFKKWIDDEIKQRYSFEHLQGYLDEYNFRTSYKRNPQRNFDIIIRAMMKDKE